MQKYFNVTFPLACPHCLTEMLATLDNVQAAPLSSAPSAGPPWN